MFVLVKKPVRYQNISTNRMLASRVFCESAAGRTSLAEEGEFFVAVFGVPAVQASLVHALDLKALQLGTEYIILGGVPLAQISQTLRRQKHLHGPCEDESRYYREQFQTPIFVEKI